MAKRDILQKKTLWQHKDSKLHEKWTENRIPPFDIKSFQFHPNCLFKEKEEKPLNCGNASRRFVTLQQNPKWRTEGSISQYCEILRKSGFSNISLNYYNFFIIINEKKCINLAFNCNKTRNCGLNQEKYSIV